MCSFRTGIRSQAAGFHWLKWMSFGYGPRVMMTGNWPVVRGAEHVGGDGAAVANLDRDVLLHEQALEHEANHEGSSRKME